MHQTRNWFTRRAAWSLCRLTFAATLVATALVPPVALAGSLPPAAVLDQDLSAPLAAAPSDARIPVIVVGTPASGDTARAQRADAAVRRAGGSSRGQFGLLGATAATLTPSQIRALASDPSVVHVNYDRPISAAALPSNNDPTSSAGAPTPSTFDQTVGADKAWAQGIDGRNVTVAILDSGIAPDPAINSRVRARVDLVTPGHPEIGDPGGHGTHVAGLVAANSSLMHGVAPGASLASVRVLDATGNGRISSAIAGLEWAVDHRRDLGVRVAVMALSAPSTGSYRTDPLAAAAELAWHAGIVIVAAAGNDGPTANSVATPGFDAFIITVGADDENLTASTADDRVPSFSSHGPTADGIAKPDFIAPGRRLVSLRVVGSTIDNELPTHREPNGLLRLTGTSMAAGVTAGAVADLLQQRPELTADQVKALLVGSARPLAGVDRAVQGAGVINLPQALRMPTPGRNGALQHALPSVGLAQTLATFSAKTASGAEHWDRVLSDTEWKARTPWDSSWWQTYSASWSHSAWDTNSAWDHSAWDANSAWDHSAWDANSAWDHSAWDMNSAWDHSAWDTNSAWDHSAWDANSAWDHSAWDVNSAWDHSAWDTNSAGDHSAWDVAHLD